MSWTQKDVEKLQERINNLYSLIEYDGFLSISEEEILAKIERYKKRLSFIKSKAIYS